MPSLSVVIPFYNEPSLALLFERLENVSRTLKQQGLDLEIILVDDGSDSDHTWAEVKAFKGRRKSVKAVRLARNFGAFHAMKTGFGVAGGDCVAPLSADLQDPPELLLEMAQKWQAGHKFVIAVRQGRDEALSTRLFAGLYYQFIRRLAIRDFPSAGYDVALMDKQLLPYLLQSSVMLNCRLLAYWLGFTPEVIYYQRAKRAAGESHWGLGKRINLFVSSIMGFSIWPARFVLYSGLLLSALGLAAAIWQVASGGALLLALAILALGFVVTALGLIAEYLWRIYAQVSQLPEVVIDEVL